MRTLPDEMKPLAPAYAVLAHVAHVETPVGRVPPPLADWLRDQALALAQDGHLRPTRSGCEVVVGWDVGTGARLAHLGAALCGGHEFVDVRPNVRLVRGELVMADGFQIVLDVDRWNPALTRAVTRGTWRTAALRLAADHQIPIHGGLV